ncbi:glycerate kinase, partial [Staphylococcus pseudintermedius]|uniref:glycerate kinase n=1 Tax=Staphylococcus pseudintermedius TaxID=283734 RepID=UPI000E361C61
QTDAGITVIEAGQFLKGTLPLVEQSSYGVGEVMRQALDKNGQHMIISVGAIDTCDVGSGMLQALGAQFYDDEGSNVDTTKGGGQSKNVSRIDLEDLHGSV